MRGGLEGGIYRLRILDLGLWNAGKKEVGKMRRWEKNKTEAFDCGLWIAECGMKKGGKCMEGGMNKKFFTCII
jgi:hypothetical protein